MSRVIDGEDILARNSLLAIVMSESLDGHLQEMGERISPGVLSKAKELFSTAFDPSGKQRKTQVTYRLLSDMLKRVKKIRDSEVDSELRKMATAMGALTSDGRQVLIDRESYKTLRDLFEEMYEESGNYVSALGQHSPYSIGTFDDDDE